MNSIVKKSILNTFWWLINNSFFGLAPLIIASILYFVKGQSLANLSKMIDEGIILFFCAAICGSAMVDYTLCEKRFKKRNEYIINVSPYILLLVIGVIFSELFSSSISVVQRNKLILWQYVIIVISLIYVFIIKTVIFISEEKNNRDNV